MDPFNLDDESARALLKRARDMLRAGALQRLPGPIRNKIDEQIDDLIHMLAGDRLPRFAVVGRRGAGKSSLINAIFGQAVAEIGATAATTMRGRWFTYESERGGIEVLDTRGLGEGAGPVNGEGGPTPMHDVHEALAERCPDALLVLCKAKEMDARIDEDLANVRTILEQVERKHGYALPVVGVVTQVDELDPADLADPPFDDPEKAANIRAVQGMLRTKLAEELGIDPARVVDVVPTCAYLRFRDGRIVVDRRWNIERLLLLLVEHLPRSAQVQLARVSMVKAVRLKVANTLVYGTSGVAAAVAVTPIPVADIFPLIGLQSALIVAVGMIGGKKLDLDGAREFLATMGVAVGLGLAAREIFRNMAKFVPGLGSVVGAGIAFSTTWSIGKAAIAYYIEDASAEQARAIFEREQAAKPPETEQVIHQLEHDELDDDTHRP